MAQIPKPIPHRKKFVRRDNPLRWLLIPLFVVIGSIGGAIGGELGPIAIEGGRLRFPPHFFALFAGFGALVGILPGLFGGILTVVLGKVLDQGFAKVMQGILAMAIFCLSALSGALVLGYLYLASFADC